MSATPKSIANNSRKAKAEDKAGEAPALLTFTKFVSSNALSKKVSVVDGKLHKSANAKMSTGTATRVVTDFDGFVEEVEKATPNTAFGYGTFGETFGETVKVRPKAAGAGDGVINRTKDFFRYPDGPGVMMLDNDYTAQGMLLLGDKLVSIMAKDLGLGGPGGVDTCARMHRGSASSGAVLVGDKEAKPGRGFHLYLAVEDATDIQRAGKTLFKKLWLLEKGYGFINVSSSGAMLVRGIIDDAVFSPERLDFVGPPENADPGKIWLEPVKNAKAGAGLFDTRKIKSLTDKEEKAFAKLVDAAKAAKKPEADKTLNKWVRPKLAKCVKAGMDEKAARRQLERLGRGETYDLPHYIELCFDDKSLGNNGWATVGDILKDADSMRRYNRKALADPLEGPDYGETKAMFYANFKGEDDDGNEEKAMPFIHSFAHGLQRYFPKTQEQIEASGSGNPVIFVEGGSLSDNVTEGERVLIEAKVELYQQGPRLVRPVRSKKAAEAGAQGGQKGKAPKGVAIPDGAVYLEVADKVWVRDTLNRHAQWLVYDGRSKKEVQKDCPAAVAETLVARVGQWELPALAGLSACPTMDLKTGRVISANGYDDSSGVYVAYDGPKVEMLAETGLDCAHKAVNMLLRPLMGFPFVKEGGRQHDRSVALAAILTAIVRKGLNTAPLHAFDATTRGSGKGLLASVVSIIATGSRPPMINAGQTDEETDKRVSTVLMMGMPVVCIDNVSKPLGGDVLNTCLTEQSLQGRVLGKSENKDLHSSVMLMATGNNLRFEGDLARRVVRCKIDPEMERPEEREFPDMPDLRGWVAKERGRLLGAALSLLREFGKAGKPKPDGYKPMGSFEDWSDNIRACLIWAGEDDPYGNRREIDQTDPVLSQLAEFHAAWREVFAEGAEVLVSDILRAAQGNFDGPQGKDSVTYVKTDSRTPYGQYLNNALKDAIIGLTNKNKGIEFVSARALNDRLHIHSGRVVEGLKISSKRDTKANTMRWSVLEVKKA
jgi:hypothetical protein